MTAFFEAVRAPRHDLTHGQPRDQPILDILLNAQVVDPSAVRTGVLDPAVLCGSLNRFGADSLIVDERAAATDGPRPGMPVTVWGPDGARHDVTAAAVVRTGLEAVVLVRWTGRTAATGRGGKGSAGEPPPVGGPSQATPVALPAGYSRARRPVPRTRTGTGHMSHTPLADPDTGPRATGHRTPAPGTAGCRPSVASTRADLAALLSRPAGTRAVVMTMGALHEGHATLIREARRRADQVVVTVFVNPLQFGAHEDLDRYPRTFDADLAVCTREGADIVFAPAVIHDPAPLVTLSAGPLGEILEGASRPGHFDGMLTLVATMLHLTRPDLAFFGRKDAQQLVCIRRMVADLAFPVTVVGVPTVREPDGLALSSRNTYLTTPQRASALALSRALAAGVHAHDLGADAVLAAASAALAAEPGVAVDYLALARPDDLGPVTDAGGPALLLVAAKVGTTRLIDNIELTLPAVTGTRREA
jgi:pantoate--beta-alanine ligase